MHELGRDGEATGINERGQVVGYIWNGVWPETFTRAFLWQEGVMTDLGTLDGADASVSSAVNNRGQVVGSSGGYAFIWERGVMTNLGSLGDHDPDRKNQSAAYGINNHGQVVGYSLTDSGTIHAFLWERGVMHDLGTLGGNNSLARAINDRGQIVGYSDTGSTVHATLWQRTNP